MADKKWVLLLADDDDDDCHFFKEAVEELPMAIRFMAVYDGEQLMQWLTRMTEPLPDVLFLDLNMPRKSGYECLVDIKRDDHLKSLPVVILSTSFEPAMAEQLYQNGAQYCLRKPADFSQLKQLIQRVLQLLVSDQGEPPKEGFVLNGA